MIEDALLAVMRDLDRAEAERDRYKAALEAAKAKNTTLALQADYVPRAALVAAEAEANRLAADLWLEKKRNQRRHLRKLTRLSQKLLGGYR